jgi:hypothetical protein
LLKEGVLPDFFSALVVLKDMLLSSEALFTMFVCFAGDWEQEAYVVNSTR